MGTIQLCPKSQVRKSARNQIEFYDLNKDKIYYLQEADTNKLDREKDSSIDDWKTEINKIVYQFKLKQH